ncbi:MAG: DedA family protein [Ignavibacteriaceae bacterium]
MEYIQFIFDFIIHIDDHLNEIILQYGAFTNAILFVIIFAETGLVFTPFLPGDSLLFASGAFAARGSLDVHLLFFLLTVAAIFGDTANYWMGHYLGNKLFMRFPKVLKKEYVDRTHNFFEKYGGKTIIIARFVPIVRTFAPFIAGVGAMTYSRFILYNIAGAVLWVAMFVYGGYFFGNLPFVQKNFSLVILAIIILSVLPGVIEYLRHRKQAEVPGNK